MAQHYDNRPKKASCFKVRLIILILATLCPIVCYIGRQNLSIAIVSMVADQKTTIGESELTMGEGQSSRLDRLFDSNSDTSDGRQLAALDTSCPLQQESSAAGGGDKLAKQVRSYGPKYDWDADKKQWIFSAFYYPYVIFQIPAARVAERFGPKWILLTAALGTSLLSLLSPWAASMHVYALAGVRALMGLCQAALYPALFVLYAKWLPPVERSLAIPILVVGAYIGSIITSSLTGFFSESEQLGWEYAFYTPGLLCALWFLLWLCLGSNEPRQHRLISLEELSYIESKMEQSNSPGAGGGGGGGNHKLAISWRKLFGSQSIWSMMAAFFSSNWSFTVVLLLLPSYLNDILHIPPLKNGVINSIIYALYCVASPIVGSCSTIMIETRAFGLSRLNIRKLFQCTALFGQALCFVALPLIGCDQFWVLGCLFLQIILFSFTNGGEVHIATELSVDFSGTIYAIGNCVGSSTGVIVPYLYSYVVRNGHNHQQWDTFFYIAAAICTVGGLIFMFFGQNQLQDFSDDSSYSQVHIRNQSMDSIDDKNGSFKLASCTMTPGQDHKPQQVQCVPMDFLQQQQQQQQQASPQQLDRQRALWLESARNCQYESVQRL